MDEGSVLAKGATSSWDIWLGHLAGTSWDILGCVAATSGSQDGDLSSKLDMLGGGGCAGGKSCVQLCASLCARFSNWRASGGQQAGSWQQLTRVKYGLGEQH